MSEQVASELIIGVLVLGLLVVRQLRTRPVNNSGARLMLILGVIGLIETVQFFDHHHGAGSFAVAALAGSLVLAAIFGVLRASTTKIWLENGQAWSKGNWLTASLWVVAVAAHLGYDALLDTHHGLSGLGNATIVLYLAISLGVQRLIVAQRAQRLGGGSGPGGPAPTYGTGPFDGTSTGN
jgi:hypothetical protein